MAPKNVFLDYDNEEDLLSISSVNDKVKFSFDIKLPVGDFIINYGFNGRIIGVEFSNASVFFPILRQKDLRKAKAGLRVEYGKNWAQIYYNIFVPNNSSQVIQGMIPTPMPN